MSNFFRRNKNQFPRKVDLGTPNCLSVDLSFFFLSLVFIRSIDYFSVAIFRFVSFSFGFFLSFFSFSGVCERKKNKIMNNFNRKNLKRRVKMAGKGENGREWERSTDVGTQCRN